MADRNKMPHVLLFGLGEELTAALTPILSGIAASLTRRESADGSLKLDRFAAPIVFCPADRDVIQRLRRANQNISLVAVSRLPEVNQWLDALEAGAADYCAAPFEKSHIGWLLQNVAATRMAA